MSTKIYDIIDTENGVKFHVNRIDVLYYRLMKQMRLERFWSAGLTSGKTMH